MRFPAKKPSKTKLGYELGFTELKSIAPAETFSSPETAANDVPSRIVILSQVSDGA